jgi:hypothetical protein
MDIKKMDVKEKILFAIKNLDIASNMYYEAFIGDNYYIRNQSPQFNLNYQGYMYQHNRSLLLRKILNKENISTSELRFLKMQPQIKELFDSHPDLEFYSLPNITLKQSYSLQF